MVVIGYELSKDCLCLKDDSFRNGFSKTALEEFKDDNIIVCGFNNYDVFVPKKDFSKDGDKIYITLYHGKIVFNDKNISPPWSHINLDMLMVSKKIVETLMKELGLSIFGFGLYHFMERENREE